MEKKEKIRIYNLIILDKSGSMCSIADAAIEGFNSTVDGIREAQNRYESQQHYVSLLPFCDCSIDYVYKQVPVEKVRKLTRRNYTPCCCTPLYDAIGKGITDILGTVQNIEEASVIVTIITDGLENASTHYTGSQIKSLIDEVKEKYGWDFAYIGTNQDVESVAKDLSINNNMYFEDTSEGYNIAMKRERRSMSRRYAQMDVLYVMMPSESSIQEMLSNLNARKRYIEFDEIHDRVTPVHITDLKPNQIFVFGSNPLGHHSGGAANIALTHFGAKMGQAEGLQGNSYAIISTEGYETLAKQMRQFVIFAEQHKELHFFVTAIGCGHAGFTPREVANLYAPLVNFENVSLPEVIWKELI